MVRASVSAAKERVTVREVSVDAVVELTERIPEFAGKGYDAAHFEQRYAGKDPLLLAAFLGKQAVGYAVGYDRYQDGSYYCWMAGVLPSARRNGALTALIARLEREAKGRGYKHLRVKTRNSRRAMLAYLVKNGYQAIGFQRRAPASENRILFEKAL